MQRPSLPVKVVGDFSFLFEHLGRRRCQIFRCKGKWLSSNGLGIHCQQTEIFLSPLVNEYFGLLAT